MQPSRTLFLYRLPFPPHPWPCLLPPITGPLACIFFHSNKSNYLFQWLPVLWKNEAMIELPGNRYRGPAGNVLMVAALNKLCASKLALIFTETAPICSRELQNSYPILVLKFFIIYRQSLCETWTKKQTVCRKRGHIQLHLLLIIWKKSNCYFTYTLACIITHCEMGFFFHQTSRKVLRFLISHSIHFTEAVPWLQDGVDSQSPTPQYDGHTVRAWGWEVMANYHQFLCHLVVPQEYSLHTESFSLHCIWKVIPLGFFPIISDSWSMFQYPLQSLEEFLLWQQLLYPFILLWMDALGFPTRELKFGEVSLSRRLKTSEHRRTALKKCGEKTFRAVGRKYRSNI